MQPTVYLLHLSLSFEPDRGFDQRFGPLNGEFICTINGYEIFNSELACIPNDGQPDLTRSVNVGEGLHQVVIWEQRSGHKVEIPIEVRCETWVTLYAWGKHSSKAHPRFSYYLDARAPDLGKHQPPQ